MSTFRRGRATPQKCLKAYQKTGSTRAAAKLIGVSHWTVQRHLHALGVNCKRKSCAINRYLPSRQYSDVSWWLKQHPNAKLPRSPTKLAFIIGVSVDSVKCYLYRRRKYERERALRIPDIRRLEFAYRVGDELVNAEDIKFYNLVVDPWTFDYRVFATLTDGRSVSFHLKRSFYDVALRRMRSQSAREQAVHGNGENLADLV